MKILEAINEQIVIKSNLDQHRDYLGLSKIADCPRAVVREYRNGIKPDAVAYRFCFAGYEQERSILDLLDSAGILEPGTAGMEIVAPFDRRLRGHIDGLTRDGELLEIKSVTVDKFRQVVNSSRAIRKHFIQVQLYMLYSGIKRANIIYRCRETYEHEVIHVSFNFETAKTFEDKASRILKAIDDNILPACECGRCK